MDGRNAPWNKDHAQGQRRALSPAQVRRIKEILAEKGRLRDLALFSLALDTLLRASDLLGVARLGRTGRRRQCPKRGGYPPAQDRRNPSSLSNGAEGLTRIWRPKMTPRSREVAGG